MENKNENIIRTVMKNEITWMVFLVGCIWGVVSTIVLPLQKLQIQSASIQEQLITQTSAYAVLATTVQTILTKQQVDETQINFLLGKK